MLEKLPQITAEQHKHSALENSSLSAALSLSLCCENAKRKNFFNLVSYSAFLDINRVWREMPRVRPRVLVMHASGDSSHQYIPLMNAIFSAQKAGIMVDSCVLGQHESTFLQQAAQLTNGIYLRPQNQRGLIQYMMSTYLADSNTRYGKSNFVSSITSSVLRKYLALPQQANVDFRASCFCHKKVVDLGYVCSVCLSSRTGLIASKISSIYI